MAESAAAASGALPGPDFLAHPDARDSRRLTSIGNLSSERLAFRMLEFGRFWGPSLGEEVTGRAAPASLMIPAQLPRETVPDMALLQNAFSCHFRIPIRHTHTIA